MKISIKEFNDAGVLWDAFVDSHPAGTNYHRYAWRSVVEKSFGHKGVFIVASDHTGMICGILPLVHMKSAMFGNFLVSMPFFNYGGLLCSCKTAEQALLIEAERLREEKGAEYVELRHRNMCVASLPTRMHKVTMILELEGDGETQWKRLNAKVRNQVRKAEKSGLLTVSGHAGLLNGFYEVFCRNMRDLGTPVYGKDFFRNVLETFPNYTQIISVQKNGLTIASGLLTWFKDTLEVPWASSIRDFRDFCPNNLLYWEAIKFAISRGFKRFDFGRSTPDEGTYRFKKQWGAEPVHLNWQYLLGKGKEFPGLNPKNPKYRLAVNTWKRLPVAVTKILGPRLVRNIP